SFLSIARLPPRPTLFPYTTLFRSGARFLPPPDFLLSLRCAARFSCAFLRASCFSLSFCSRAAAFCLRSARRARFSRLRRAVRSRSEEHTSELQSRFDLVCRLLLAK